MVRDGWGSGRGAGAVDVGALARAPMVAFDRYDALQERFLRPLVGRGVTPPVHHVPSQGAFLEVVRAGLGWGMVPDVAARGPLEAGDLVEVVPGRSLDVPLFWQHWKVDAPRLADLTERVVAAAAPVLHG